jgi:hypothetical protein
MAEKKRNASPNTQLNFTAYSSHLQNMIHPPNTVRYEARWVRHTYTRGHQNWYFMKFLHNLDGIINCCSGILELGYVAISLALDTWLGYSALLPGSVGLLNRDTRFKYTWFGFSAELFNLGYSVWIIHSDWIKGTLALPFKGDDERTNSIALLELKLDL